jgi:hypothetical protein
MSWGLMPRGCRITVGKEFSGIRRWGEIMQWWANFRQQSASEAMVKTSAILLSVVLSVCLTLGGRIPEAVADNVCGNLIVDTTWTKANSPYMVTCGVLVASGVTLTIEPGVQVRFQGNYSLDIDGTLIARGTSADPIRFTTHTPGQYWGYIYFRDDSTDAAYDEKGEYIAGSIMQHCLVEYAGGTTVTNNGAVRLNKAHPLIDSCTMRFNKSRGIAAWGLTGTLKIANNIINYNKDSGNGGGIWIQQTSYPNPNLTGLSRVFNNVIQYNESSLKGGGIMASATKVIISHNFIAKNISQNGGGIYSDYASHNISNNLLLNNTATANGGGLAGRGAQAFNNIFSDNEATYGGGFYNEISGGTTLGYNAFVRNAAINNSVWYLGYSTDAHNNLVAFNKNTGSEPTQDIFLRSTGMNINFNSLFGNANTYELFNNNLEGSADINAVSNWWGTEVQSEIEAKIYDFHLDPAKGVVDFFPWEPAPRTDVPISPPQELTLTQAGRSITLTWRENPEGDVAGYRIYWGAQSGYPYAHARDVKKVTGYTFPTGDIPPGVNYFAVTAYDRDYLITDPTDPKYVADAPQTPINEKQTAGYESWFSPEGSAQSRGYGPASLMLLLDG